MSKEGVWGLFTGTVVNNDDPLLQGRIKVAIPQVLGTAASNWAVPNAAYNTDPNALVLPAPKQLVWIQFIGGDTNRPTYAYDPTTIISTLMAEVATLQAEVAALASAVSALS